jgi:hypothetical protein
MRHSMADEIRKDEEAAKNWILRIALTSGTVMTGLLVIVLVAVAFLLMR